VFRNVLYPTAEHAFHCAKFDDEKIKEEIRNARSPLDAFELGKKYKPHRREDWDETKVNILYEILKEKFSQHEEAKKALLDTGSEKIVENNPNDDFWGNGRDGNGRNNTGKILMKIREELL
jgi:ribA/ribD-fused uncharacterized protein